MSNHNTLPLFAASPQMHSGLRRFSVQQFLIVLILLIITEPFIEKMEHGRVVETVLVVFVLLFAVLAVGAGRRNLCIGIGLLVPILLGRLANHIWPHLVPREFIIIPGIIFAFFVVGQLLRFILSAPRVTAEVLCAGVSAYLLLGVLWAFSYIAVSNLIPDAFSFSVTTTPPQTMQGFNSLYFSFITLNTVGYGDMVPVAPIAKLLSIVESTVGLMFMALLIARLVSLYNSKAGEKPPHAENQSAAAKLD